MPGSYACLLYHIVFSTRERRQLLSADLRPRLWDYMGGILRRHDCDPLRIGGTSDHAHVVMSIGRDKSVAAAVRDLKSNSSRWLREEFPELAAFAWQEGYAAFTIGIAGLERNTRYIQRQEEHHRKRSLQEELVAFLDRHQVAYDPERIWE